MNNNTNNQNSSVSSSNLNMINNITNNNNNNNSNSNNRKSTGLAQQTATSIAMTMNAAAVTTMSSSTTTNCNTMNNSGSGNLSSSPTFVKSATKILINGKDVMGDGSSSGTTPATTTMTTTMQQIQNQIDNKNNCNEIEEACLLGIDCNEKTTVGLVLRILGDTAIRLDGDGYALALLHMQSRIDHLIWDFCSLFSAVSVLVAAGERTFSNQFPCRRCGQRCRHCTRFAPRPGRINSIREVHRTSGFRITMSASIQIVRV